MKAMRGAAILAWLMLGVVAGAGCDRSATSPPTSVQPPLPVGARTFLTAHYRIDATAGYSDAQSVGDALEALHAAYTRDFAIDVPPGSKAPLRVVLYRDRREFQRFNRSKPWAEAYYLPPVCHAYFDASAANPVHWMLHEATHQLNREVAGFPAGRQWLDEGLATYYGSSRLEGGRLQVGSPDFHAYPLWWLVRFAPTGDAAGDFRSGRLIRPQALFDGTGPPIDTHVNQYYVAYWSFTHFLFHADGARYAPGFRRFIASGRGRADFERMVAPLAELEPKWYRYLGEMARLAASEGQDDDDAVLIQ